MTYETIAGISQSAALVFFMILFACVVVYVFWPGNKRKFEKASRLPFENNPATEQDGSGNQERKS